MPIDVVCPSCNKRLRVADKYAGKKIRCPGCQGVLDMPNAAVASAAPPASAEPPSPKTAKPPPPRRPAARWHVHAHDGKQYGPITKEELDSWVAEGLISPSCQLLQDGTQQWMPAAQVYPQLSPAGGSISGTEFGNAFDGETFDPSGVARLPAGQLDGKRQKVVNSVQRTLNLECPKLGCQIVNGTGFEVGPGPQGWLAKMNAKGMHIPLLEFGQSEVNIDFLSAFEINHPEGEFLAVFPREGIATMPQQFASVMPGSLPNSIALERGAMGAWSSGSWSSYYEDDPLVAAANQNASLGDGVKWDWKMHMPGMVTTIKLPWTIQALPVGMEHYLFIVQTVMAGGFIANFRVGWFLERRRAFAHFVAQCGGGEGDYEADFMYPSEAILPLIMKYGQGIADAYEFED